MWPSRSDHVPQRLLIARLCGDTACLECKVVEQERHVQTGATSQSIEQTEPIRKQAKFCLNLLICVRICSPREKSEMKKSELLNSAKILRTCRAKSQCI